jgi:RNA recognition motif-containing protein
MAQKLFIGGLSFSTSTERLREVFAQAGQVESAAVVLDRDTGQSRGFGFVEMSTDAEAEAAIARFNGKELDGRQVRVERASASSKGRDGSRGRPARGGRW